MKPAVCRGFSATAIHTVTLTLIFALTLSGTELPVAAQTSRKASSSVDASTASTTTVHISIDALSDRHEISPYVYGFAYPNAASDITNTGATEVRWGGNSTSRYNWTAGTINTANDWYFGDYSYSEIGDSDSAKYIQDVKAAGSHPLMTMVMLPWVAKDVTNGSAYSFSVAKYGAQCSVNPYNSDNGNGVESNCSTNITGNDPNDADVPIKDTPSAGDPPGTVYRSQWTAALAAAFGTAPHFYDMDNEIDIWGSTHRDVHPAPTAYNEMRDTFIAESRALKGWDPQAIRFGPVSCCWWFYWNGANNNDKTAHAGIDLLPWWLNEVYWQDKIAGTRSVDVFDIHAYPDLPDTSSYTLAQKQALALRIFRDYWDPTYVSESSSINQNWATFLQPNKTIPFRIPRMRAIANMIYPNTPLSFTEWNAAVAGESDFSSALGDADAYGILGRERIYLASRWVAPVSPNPNYQALKLYRNYDGAHHTFAPISVADTNDGDPSLFSSCAAIGPAGKRMTIMVINKSPTNTVTAQFALNGFTPAKVTSYTLSTTNPTSIVASSNKAWSSSMNFAPYSATLLVVKGDMAQLPAADWDLNPDTIQLPANGRVTLAPKIISGTGTVTLGTPQFDTGITLAVTQGTVSASQHGAITVTAGATPGFYHYSVPSTDSAGVAEQQSGWILVGNPAATLTKQGDNQTGMHGTTLNLSATLNPGSSGGTAAGATVFFTTSAGTLSARTVTTNASGIAAVVLTLPATAGTVHVTAEGPYGLGHPEVTFTETSQ
jgi:Glycoside hydrolase family 44